MRYWGDLPRVERRRFGLFHFARANIKSWDEQKLRLAYDLRAFGGTPHTEEQRAAHRPIEDFEPVATNGYASGPAATNN